MYGSFYGEGSKQSLVASKVRTLFYFPAEEKKLESIDHIKQNGEKRREINPTDNGKCGSVDWIFFRSLNRVGILFCN